MGSYSFDWPEIRERAEPPGHLALQANALVPSLDHVIISMKLDFRLGFHLD